MPLVLLTLFGTLGATLGRGGFALSVKYIDIKLPHKMRENAKAVASAIRQHERRPTLFVAIYSALPLPSNPLLVAIGMGAMPLKQAMIGYFFGRWVNNTVMLLVAQPVTDNFSDLFRHSVSWSSLFLTVSAIAIYLIFLSLPWKRWLHID